MSATESRSGFRLPWSSDRSHESVPADAVADPVAEDAPLFPGARPVRLGGSPAEVAHGLFDALRTTRRGSVLRAYAVPRRGLLRLRRSVEERVRGMAVKLCIPHDEI